MKVRILPPEEWNRLPEEVVAACVTLTSENVAAVVAEEAGEIVGRVLVMRAPHLEAWWVAPERFGNAGVTRGLLRAASAQSRAWNSAVMYANADPGPMCDTLERLGGKWLPVMTFMLSSGLLAKESECPTESTLTPHSSFRSDPTTAGSPGSSSEPTHRQEETVCRQ